MKYLTNNLSKEELYSNLFKYGVIVIKGCFFDTDDYYSFARKYFSHMSVHPHSRENSNKFILKMSPGNDNNYSGTVPLDWHQDHAYRPGHFVTLNQNVKNAQIVKTYFIDTRKPIKDLDLEYFSKITVDINVSDKGTWQKNFFTEEELRTKLNDRNIKVMRKHGVTSDKCIFTSPPNIKKMYNDDKDLYKKYLYNLDPYDNLEYREVLEWEEGDVLIYDNIIVSHKRDTIPPNTEREMWRIVARLDKKDPE